jgi:uncharacterized protein DUF3943
MRHIAAATVAALALPFTAAAQSDSTPGLPPRLAAGRPLRAVTQSVTLNVAVNRADAWVFSQDWANSGTRVWGRNLRFGWAWDEDQFGTNLMMHPYHGALYFNAARANGLSFWEAAPVVLLGSWTWEYFGETERPSLNDFFMTSFGGIALGEIFHRLGATIRDNGSRHRVLREIAAFPLDPMGWINRPRGRNATLANPPEHAPGALSLRLHGGARFVVDSRLHMSDGTPSLLVDFGYGDQFLQPYRAPFDAFRLRAVFGDQGLNALRATGRLYGPRTPHRHLFLVNQRFDYVNNSAYRVGGQSIEGGLESHWPLPNEWQVRTEAYLDAILLGGIDARTAGFGQRNYDFGPGGGVRFRVELGRRGWSYFAFSAESDYIHAVSGASADHFLAFGGFEITLPLGTTIGLGIHNTTFLRRSVNSDRPDEIRRFPELRVFLTWTQVSWPRFGVPQPTAPAP